MYKRFSHALYDFLYIILLYILDRNCPLLFRPHKFLEFYGRKARAIIFHIMISHNIILLLLRIRPAIILCIFEMKYSLYIYFLGHIKSFTFIGRRLPNTQFNVIIVIIIL